jgi:hypothetical protein
MTRGKSSATGCAFGVGNVLVTFPAVGGRKKAENRDDPEIEMTSNSTTTSAKCGLNQVTWETTLYQPVFRKLVNESSRTFLALQKLMSNEDGEREFLNLYSKTVRGDLAEQLAGPGNRPGS